MFQTIDTKDAARLPVKAEALPPPGAGEFDDNSLIKSSKNHKLGTISEMGECNMHQNQQLHKKCWSTKEDQTFYDAPNPSLTNNSHSAQHVEKSYFF